MDFKTKARKIGGSMSIIIPKDVVETENIEPKDNLHVLLTKESGIGRFFGTLKTKKTGQQLKNEAREAWE